jgi:hypothetical protein
MSDVKNSVTFNFETTTKDGRFEGKIDLGFVQLQINNAFEALKLFEKTHGSISQVKLEQLNGNPTRYCLTAIHTRPIK